VKASVSPGSLQGPGPDRRQDEQRLVRGASRADPGTADYRASERLPRPVEERKAGIAERARKIAGDQDRLGAK